MGVVDGGDVARDRLEADHAVDVHAFDRLHHRAEREYCERLMGERRTAELHFGHPRETALDRAGASAKLPSDIRVSVSVVAVTGTRPLLAVANRSNRPEPLRSAMLPSWFTVRESPRLNDHPAPNGPVCWWSML